MVYLSYYSKFLVMIHYIILGGPYFVSALFDVLVLLTTFSMSALVTYEKLKLKTNKYFYFYFLDNKDRISL